MKEQTTIEREFYINLYYFYKSLRTSKGYFNPIRNAYYTLKFFDENKDNLEQVDKTDLHNMLLLTRILLEEEYKHNIGKILRGTLRIRELKEYVDKYDYLAK